VNFGLDQTTISCIQAVFFKHSEVEQVLIYGSRAKGDFREGSDVDLTLQGKSLSNTLLSEIKLEIDELNTPYLFDISILEGLASPSLEEHIARVGKVFYKEGK